MFMEPPGRREPARKRGLYCTRMAAGKIAVFGVPSAAGGARPRARERAAFALREAGLLDGAARRGRRRVVNLSDLSLFPFRDDPEHPRARNAEVVACAVRATADEMTRALAEGFTLVLGRRLHARRGGGGRRAGGPRRSPWASSTSTPTPTSTRPRRRPSGYLNGMALALALGPRARRGGGGGRRSARPCGPSTWRSSGFRALDPGERARARRPGPGAARRGGARARHARDGGPGPGRASSNDDGPIVVHLDVDVIDPAGDAGQGGAHARRRALAGRRPPTS